jgi:hypothetical protein
MGGPIEVTAAAGKVIQEMMVYGDSPYCRQVVLKFTDGTEMVVELEVRTIATVKHYQPHPGEMEMCGEPSQEFVAPSYRRDAIRQRKSHQLTQFAPVEAWPALASHLANKTRPGTIFPEIQRFPLLWIVSRPRIGAGDHESTDYFGIV